MESQETPGFERSSPGFSMATAPIRMTGDVDYLLKVRVRDLDHYDKVYQKLINYVPDLSDVSSSFWMEKLNRSNDVNLSLIA
ncbi:MAG: Lrp/AsnC ligand binding domain-containing protein [Pseudomonadota bacterium]